MILFLLILLFVVYNALFFCINTKYLIESSVISQTNSDKKYSGSKVYITVIDFFYTFFELLFVTLLMYLFYIYLFFPVFAAFVVSFIITFVFVELVLKLIVKSSYDNENDNRFNKSPFFASLIKFLFRASFVIIPAAIKKSIKENPLYDPFLNESEKAISQSTGKEDEGVVEQEIIDRVFDLGELSVYEVMRPRTEIAGVDISDSISEVHKAFVDSGYSKLIVYDENVDNIKGVVFAYDLFKSPKDLKSILREVIFVPENKKSIEMLNLFLDKRISIAVVVDEFGGTAGIVTMEDIIEELFGEIKDEYDVEENVCKMISPNSYIFSAKVEIDYINETFDLNIPYGDYETIGGLIITYSGRIPSKGEIVKIDRFSFNIIRSGNTKIDLVKMIITQ